MEQTCCTDYPIRHLNMKIKFLILLFGLIALGFLFPFSVNAATYTYRYTCSGPYAGSGSYNVCTTCPTDDYYCDYTCTLCAAATNTPTPTRAPTPTPTRAPTPTPTRAPTPTPTRAPTPTPTRAPTPTPTPIRCIDPVGGCQYAGCPVGESEVVGVTCPISGYVCCKATATNGVCYYATALPYLCNPGTSINNNENATTWTWNCQGYNGGTTSGLCTKTKPTPTPTPTPGGSCATLPDCGTGRSCSDSSCAGTCPPADPDFIGRTDKCLSTNAFGGTAADYNGKWAVCCDPKLRITALSATVSGNRVNVSWTTNMTVTHVTVWRGLTSSGPWTQKIPVPVSSPYQDNPPNGGEWWYGLHVEDNFGNIADDSDVGGPKMATIANACTSASLPSCDSLGDVFCVASTCSGSCPKTALQKCLNSNNQDSSSEAYNAGGATKYAACCLDYHTHIAIDCAAGEFTQGSCHTNVPPITDGSLNGIAMCNDIALKYNNSHLGANISVNSSNPCMNACTSGVAQVPIAYSCPVPSECSDANYVHSYMSPRPDPVFNSPDGWCDNAAANSPGTDSICCNFITGTPTPTPTAWLVKGMVFYDINKDGIANGDDPVYGPGANISVRDLNGGTPTPTPGNYSTSDLGFYQTPHMWPDKHTTVVNLTTSLPSNCMVKDSLNPVNAYMDSDRTVNFPLVGPVTIQGRNVDKDGIALTAPTIGQNISISGPANATRTSLGAWDFTGVSSGTYTVTAAIPAGYTVSYSYPGKNTSPTPTNRVYSPGNVVTGITLHCGEYVDIWFKYTPSNVTIQGHFVDGTVSTSDVFIPRILNGTSRSISISGGELATPIEPDTYGSLADSYLWKKVLIKSNNPFTVTVSPPISGYEIGVAPCLNSSSCGSPRSYSSADSTTFTLPNSGNYADIYFKYTPCRVKTTPSLCNLKIGEYCMVSASVTSGLGAGKILQMRFGSYNTTVATVSPTSDSTPLYQTTATAKALGLTAVWATADVDDNNDGTKDRICETTGDTDTDINVTDDGGPIPTSIPTGMITSTPAPTRTPTPTPTIDPGPFTISGRVFIDTGKDGRRVNIDSTVDAAYTGAVTISVVNNATSISYAATNTGGTYTTGNVLPPGTYTVTFSGPLAASMGFTYPFPNPVNRFLSVTVGSSCSASGLESSCSGRNIINLNAGIVDITTGADAWFQSVGSDMKWDRPGGFGFTDRLYTLPLGKYASAPGTGGMPGIIFSGPVSFNQPAQASQAYNWQVQGDIFTATHNLIPTSYAFISGTAQSSGITLTALPSLDNTIAHGIYKTAGDLTISSPVNIGASCGALPLTSPCNFIILVSGNLTINANIAVPVGATVIFSASGNIMVGSGVTQIAGLYSADGNFITNSASNCPATADSALNVAGSVIANAGRRGGSFQNNRTLCANNSTTPSVTFTERPDFLLNYPSLLKLITRVWQELAP
jgi:hypothetical protein